MRSAALIAAFALALGCAAAPPPAPPDPRPTWEKLPLKQVAFESDRSRVRARTHALTGDARLTGESRMTISESVPIDYATLPILPAMELVPLASRTAPGVSVVSNPIEKIARIDASRSTAFEAVFDGQSIGPFWREATRPPCGRDAYWLTLDGNASSEQALAIEAAQGHLNGEGSTAACAAFAERTTSVVAPSLWRGLFYAYRECTWHCDTPDAADRQERFVLLAPRAKWLTATFSSPDQMLHRPSGALSRVAVDVRRGAAASIVLDLTEGDLASFVQRRGGEPWWKPLGLPDLGPVHASIDIVWDADDAAPRARLMLGAASYEGLALLEAIKGERPKTKK